MNSSISPMQIATLLVVLSAALSWINLKVFKLPQAVGLLVMGLLGSLGLIAAENYVPYINFADDLHAAIASIDFFDTVMNGMLSALLFAAALHVDLRSLRSVKTPIIALATVGVVISTFIIGGSLWAVGTMLGLGIPLVWALVFGSLISPTDPVAVLSVLKTAKVPKSLSAKIAGESLFNDGVGLICFTVMLAIAMATSGYKFDAHGDLVTVEGTANLLAVSQVFLIEVFGAIAMGAAAGFLCIRMIKGIDDAAVETLMSLALVLGLYTVCMELHMSGPIAVVIAGLILGNFGANNAMSERTKQHLFPFWEMTDSILNAVLFLLIGLEVMVLRIDGSHSTVALLAIPIVLFGRFLSVLIPVQGLRAMGYKFSHGTVRLMTWGGVRGGISVALALSLPEVPYKGTILAATYVVVVFTIVVQGLSIAPLAKKLAVNKERKDKRLASRTNQAA